jgi:uridine phosphorylase
LKDYSITSPEILIENSAKSKGMRPEACRVPEIVVMVYNKSELQKLVELTNASLFDWVFSSDLHPLYRGKVEKKEVSLIFPGWGAPTVAARMEELIACGAKVILASGALGAFQPEIKMGDYVIPSEAMSGEGTSRYYFPKKREMKADPEIVEVSEEACKKVGVRAFVGSVWTTDAIYREMLTQVKKLRKQGVLGVEMETSAIFAVAEFRKIKAGCILRFSDSLANLKWEMQWWHPEYTRTALEPSPKIILEALKLL